MSEIRVGVIGGGNMGRLHLKQWAGLSGVSVAAVCDADAEAASNAAEPYGAEVHTDWRQMVRRGAFDVVDICTPPRDHAEVALRAFDSGAHVLCEKPLARTAEEARAMVERAEQRERLLMTALCHRFHPPIVFAHDLIANDDLGRVVMFRNRFSGRFEGVEDKWFSDPDVAGGGTLLDTAVHSVDLFRFLVGEVATTVARTATVNPKIAVEDCGALVLQSVSGAVGVIEASWATPGGRNVVEIYGTAGACIVDYDSDRVTFRTADMPVWETREVGGPDRFQREIAHFADAVRGLQPLAITGRDGLRANEVLADAYRSAASGT